MTKICRILPISIPLFFMMAIIIFWLGTDNPFLGKPFSGEKAFADVLKQVSYGPRIPGSIAHTRTRIFISDELKKSGWVSFVLSGEISGKNYYNILATRNNAQPIILLVTHYDSRLVSDNDPVAELRSNPVPGANDGASGVAILLELARSLPDKTVPVGLLFVDIEDNGNLSGWDWILGSKAFVSDLKNYPHVVVVLDMLGDKNLKIYKENFSDPIITNQIWETAKRLGYGAIFIDENKYSIVDDHIPFLDKGIKAVDIIDIDYPYWHTTQDTPDKISPTSLQIIGNTITSWILDYGFCIQARECIGKN